MPHRKKPRMTRQRRVILEELTKAGTHPTADQIYEAVRERLPRISLGTIYRNLDFLADRGMIHRLRIGDDPMRFDDATEPHEHVRCVECRKVRDVSVDGVGHRERAVAEETGFEILGSSVEYWGLCPECSAKQEKRKE